MKLQLLRFFRRKSSVADHLQSLFVIGHPSHVVRHAEVVVLSSEAEDEIVAYVNHARFLTQPLPTTPEFDVTRDGICIRAYEILSGEVRVVGYVAPVELFAQDRILFVLPFDSADDPRLETMCPRRLEWVDARRRRSGNVLKSGWSMCGLS